MKSILIHFCLLSYCLVSFSQGSSQNITLLSNWNPDSISQYNDIWGYTDCTGNEYAILGSDSKIHFIDLENPSNPLEIASFAGGQSTIWRDIKTWRDRAYAVSDNTTEGLLIFNLSNLPQTVIKTYHSNELFNNAHSIFIDEEESRLYVVGSSEGHLQIYDLAANPDQPELIINTSLEGGYIHDIHVKNNIAYCSHLSNGLYVYDCSNPQNIATLGSLNSYLGTVFNHSSWLSQDGKQLVFCDETHGAAVKILDINDPTDLSVQAEHMFSSALEAPFFENSIAHNPFVRGQFAFVSYYHDGLQVFDIADPDNIQRVAYYDTYPENIDYEGYQGCWGVYPFLSSGTIIASDISNGLFVLSMDSLELEPTINNYLPNASLEITAAPIICKGDTVILSAPDEEGLNYLWTKNDEPLSNNESELLVQSDGVYQLVISNGVCSNSSEPHTIEFIEAPDLSEMEGDQTELCTGDNYMINAPEGLDYYLWMNNGNVLPNTNHIVQVVESGTYTLLGYQNGCASFSAPYEINVINLPAPNLASLQNITCSNEPILLEASIGADTYNWYLDGNLISSSEDPFLEVYEGGEYTVELVNSVCSEISETLSITSYSLPSNEISLSGSPMVCSGQSVWLNADESMDIASWAWTLNGELVGTNSSIEVNQTGLYLLSITNMNGCVNANQQYIEVIIPESPEISLQDATLISTEAETYQWYWNNQIIEGAVQQNYSPIQVGSYTVQTTNAIGCTSISIPIEIDLVSTTAPKNLAAVFIYPNPTSDVIHIELSSEIVLELKIQLFHINGKVIVEKTVLPSREFAEKIFVANLSTGVHLLKLTNREGSLIKKIMIQ